MLRDNQIWPGTFQTSLATEAVSRMWVVETDATSQTAVTATPYTLISATIVMLGGIPTRTLRLGGSGKLSRYTWTVRESNSDGGKIFRTRPDRPCGPPIVLCSNYRVSFPGMFRKCGMEHTGGVTPLLTDSIKQSLSYEANIVLASQEIPPFLWNLNVHYRVHTILLPFA